MDPRVLDNKEKQTDQVVVEYIGLMSRDDIIANLKQLRQDLPAVLPEAPEPPEGMTQIKSEESMLLDKIDTQTDRMAVLNRLGMDRNTPDTFAVVLYDDGVDRALLAGHSDGKEFVATKRLDSASLRDDWQTVALLGMGADNRPLTPLSESEQIRIPLDILASQEYGKIHTVQVVNLTIEEQKKLQAEMTLKAPGSESSIQIQREISNAMGNSQKIGGEDNVLTPAEFEAVRKLVSDPRDVKVDTQSGKHVEDQSSATVPDQGQPPSASKSK